MKRSKLILVETLFLLPFLGFACMGFADSNTLNVTTGASSHNDAKIEVSGDVKATVQNAAVVSNVASTDANTGNDTASKNTGDGSVESGSINGIINITNDINKSVIKADPNGMFSVDPLNAENKNTGADSENSAKATSSNNLKTSVTNRLLINNKVCTLASTGNNVANGNTGNGSVKSGNIDFLVNISNIGNQVMIALGTSGVSASTGEVTEPGVSGSGGGVSAEAEFASAESTLPAAGVDSIVLALLAAGVVTASAIAIDKSKVLGHKAV